MRILILDTCNGAFLRSHYAERPGLEREPYDQQWRSLMDRLYGTSDSYSHYLGELGHEAHEIVFNCEPLQRAWAREHRALRLAVTDRTLRAQVEDFAPDVVYVQDLNALQPRLLARLGKGRLLAGQTATRLPADETLRAYDLLLTSFPHYVDRLGALGVSTELLRIAFDPRVLDRLGAVQAGPETVFVGNLKLKAHRLANPLLEAAARRVEVDVWGTGLEAWPEGSPFRTRYRGEAWGLDMYRVLAGSRIALNRHGEVAEDRANNMRLYEATGVGTLLLTDAKRDLGDLFDVGAEVAVYHDEDELVDRVRYYLAHEEERATVAQAGQRRTLREHTYPHRMRELAAILERYRT